VRGWRANSERITTMRDLTDVSRLVAEHLSDRGTQWSLGTFGGIAEFSRDAGEAATIDIAGEEKSVCTQRGGIRIAPVTGTRPFASESVSKLGWTHRVALCLPEADCAMNGRTCLTELGPDRAGLREEDRDGVLFDLGLGALQTDLCVRIKDHAVVSELRDCVDRPVFEAGNPAMTIILAANPHRVFVSRLGRIEVYQPIPPASGQSPDGPHTHVLPELLRHQRTHPATEPVPEGWIPCAYFYPAHPIKDGLRHARPFDRAAHDAFQQLLAAYGDPESRVLKARIATLVAEGQEPGDDVTVSGRLARANIRLALRQLRAAGDRSPVLKAWLAAYDRGDDDEPDEDQQVLGH
jgi:hypothetical protein